MTVEQYLKDKCPIDLKRVAALMYPSNLSANAYLSRKLNGARPFTQKDTLAAINALKSIGAEWESIEGFNEPNK